MDPNLEHYAQVVAASDRLPDAELSPVLLGLFGEVGEVLTTAKKLVRESSAYRGFNRDAQEEFGDTLWYLVALSRRLNIRPADLELEVERFERLPPNPSPLHDSLLALQYACSEIRAAKIETERDSIIEFFRAYLNALSAAGLSLDAVVRENIRKVSGRFLDIKSQSLPDFDSGFPEDERLPDEFEFRIVQRPSGQSYLSLNGVFVGDPLTDNILEPDGYRFHDVFHMANAAILHWSPVLRALLKRKRKSNPRIDEAQDGGRAIVIEEGLTAWLFARAKPDFFANASSVSYDVLKRIDEFVAGYEVETCPPALWERSLLQGFAAFRGLATHRSGLIIGSRRDRTIRFSELG